ncbi:MAG: hypothetical protein ACFB22_12285 [Rhodothalassiaceae bacterium]
MVSLSKEELALIARAQQAVERFTAELAKLAPDWIDTLEEDLRQRRLVEARRKAVELRNMAGTTGWAPLEQSAQSFVVVVTYAPNRRLDELSRPVIDAMRKLARASDRGFTQSSRDLIAEVEALASYSRQLADHVRH